MIDLEKYGVYRPSIKKQKKDSQPWSVNKLSASLTHTGLIDVPESVSVALAYRFALILEWDYNVLFSLVIVRSIWQYFDLSRPILIIKQYLYFLKTSVV